MSSRYDGDKNIAIPVEEEKTETTAVTPTTEQPASKSPVIPVKVPNQAPKMTTESRAEDFKPNNSPKVEAVQPKTAKPMVPDAIDGDVSLALNNYLKDISESKTAKEKAEAHYSFYKIVRQVLSIEEFADFRKSWIGVLNFVRDNYDSVNELTVFQGMYEWPLGESEMTAYRYLVNLILLSRNNVDRYKALDSMDLSLLFSATNTITPHAEQNILSFYRQ